MVPSQSAGRHHAGVPAGQYGPSTIRARIDRPSHQFHSDAARFLANGDVVSDRLREELALAEFLKADCRFETASPTRDAINRRTSSVTSCPGSFSPNAMATCSQRRKTSSARPQHSGYFTSRWIGIFGRIVSVPVAKSNNRSMTRLVSSDAETRGVTRNASRAAIARIARGASRLSSFSGARQVSSFPINPRRRSRHGHLCLACVCRRGFKSRLTSFLHDKTANSPG